MNNIKGSLARRALVIGYGSIGRRHTHVLRELGCDVAVVSRHAPSGEKVFVSVAAAVREHRPDYCVIATATGHHASGIAELAATEFSGPVLVEKPLAADPRVILGAGKLRIFVGYNLRFHPVMRELRRRIEGVPVFSAQWHVSQFLPDWRAGRDYRTGYSASRSGGGGVLRDLSHELDLILWLFGPWNQLVASVKSSGSLAIETEDSASIMVSAQRCPQVVLHLNYLNHVSTRRFSVTTAADSWNGNLLTGTINSRSGIEQFDAPRDLTYRLQHEAVLQGRDDELCDAQAGIEVGTMIENIERSALEQRWIQAG